MAFKNYPKRRDEGVEVVTSPSNDEKKSWVNRNLGPEDPKLIRYPIMTPEQRRFSKDILDLISPALREELTSGFQRQQQRRQYEPLFSAIRSAQLGSGKQYGQFGTELDPGIGLQSILGILAAPLIEQGARSLFPRHFAFLDRQQELPVGYEQEKSVRQQEQAVQQQRQRVPAKGQGMKVMRDIGRLVEEEKQRRAPGYVETLLDRLRGI